MLKRGAALFTSTRKQNHANIAEVSVVGLIVRVLEAGPSPDSKEDEASTSLNAQLLPSSWLNYGGLVKTAGLGSLH